MCRHLHQIFGVNRSIKDALAYPRNISSTRIFRGPRVWQFTVITQNATIVQVGYFSMLIDSDLDTGSSRPTATYASPCLASSEKFEIDLVEIWSVTPSKEEAEDAKGTAMERFKEDKYFLEMNNTAMHSDAYRRAEPLEDEKG
jgi:hypothetical protein